MPKRLFWQITRYCTVCRRRNMFSLLACIYMQEKSNTSSRHSTFFTPV